MKPSNHNVITALKNIAMGKLLFILLSLVTIFIVSQLLLPATSAFKIDKALQQTEEEKDVYHKVLISQQGKLKGNQRIHLNFVDPTLLYVEFYIDGELVFKDEEAPWECIHNFGQKDVEHDVRVVGYYTREIQTLTLEPEQESHKEPQEETEKPSPEETAEEELIVKIISPEPNTYVSGKVLIKAEISIAPDVAIERVEFYVDKVILFADTEAPYEFEWDAGREFNRRVIEVVAFDDRGRRASDAILTKDLEGYVFEARVDLVTMDVTVTDNYGKYVAGLEQDDFLIYEEDRLQEVSHFTKLERPLALGILIDTSGSMDVFRKLSRAKVGAKKFINTLTEVDKAFVMSFANEVKVEQNFTNAAGALGRAIDDLMPEGATSLNKAVYQAIEKLKDEKGRKAIVLLSDGYDTVGEVQEEEVLEAAKKADVKIYCIGIFERYFGVQSPAKLPGSQTMRGKQFGEIVLKSFSDWTGGEAYFPNSLGELDEIYALIAEELRRQYSLGYTSNNPKRDGKWRSIEVKLKKKKLQARTKKGYYAPKGA